MAGFHNDINVFHRSWVLSRLEENVLVVHYEINGNAYYDKSCYLVDGIYLSWDTLVKTICGPQTKKMKRFVKQQETSRKDVEQTFGVLRAWWAIVHHAKTWNLQTMWEVMTCCVIMHNMIVEQECDNNLHNQGWKLQGESIEPRYGTSSCQEFLHMHVELRDSHIHNRLQTDLVEYRWAYALVDHE
jgi:hypothetical protein